MKHLFLSLILLFSSSQAFAVITLQNLTCTEASPQGRNSIIQVTFDNQGVATLTGMATAGGMSYLWSMFGPFRASGTQNASAIQLFWTDSANQQGSLIITLGVNPQNPYYVGVGVSVYGSMWTNNEMECIRAF